MDGLWRNNPALVQLLGICPLLAVTTTVVNGLGLGLATTFVLIATNCLVSAGRRWIGRAVRLIAFVLIIASFVTVVDLLTNAFFHELHETLGLFIPLIVTNCAILAQAETVASKRPVSTAIAAGLGTGAGFTGVLVALGALREIIGRGTLFDGVEQLFGQSATAMVIDLPTSGLLVVALPPGAFFGLALLVAVKNHLDARRQSRQDMLDEPDGART
jgi:electron transport complex protein RnfE